MSPSDIQEWFAFWQLGLMDPDHLRDLAYEALESGIDCQEIRQIAGDSRLGADDARELLAGALRSLGVEVPPAERAPRIVCLSVARSVLAGAIDPIWGAGFIGSRTPFEEHGPDLVGPLIYHSCDCCNGLDGMVDPVDREKRMAECGEEILAHLRKILPYFEEKAGVSRPPGAPPPLGPGFLGWNHGPFAALRKAVGSRQWVRALDEEIRRILLQVWDPIGVSRTPAARDEYDCCIPQIRRLLLAREPKAALIEHLRKRVGEHLELEYSEEQERRNDVAARRLLDLPLPPPVPHEDGNPAPGMGEG